jgi:hypothetical protein
MVKPEASVEPPSGFVTVTSTAPEEPEGSIVMSMNRSVLSKNRTLSTVMSGPGRPSRRSGSSPR